MTCVANIVSTSVYLIKLSVLIDPIFLIIEQFVSDLKSSFLCITRVK